MPHKHKRKRDDDHSNFDLAPTNRARPLPAYKPPSVFSSDGASNKRRKPNLKSRTQDDTPKAFARMMAWQVAGKIPSGLDDGSASKKDKKGKPTNSSAKSPKSTTQPNSDIAGSESKTAPDNDKQLQILPGESLADFARRVDQTLTLSSISKSSKGKSSIPNIPTDIKPRERLTKHNKRLQRMISDWRTEDTRLKEKKEEEEDDLQDQEEEEDLLWAGVRGARSDRKGKKNKSAKGGNNDDDPWKDLEKKRKEAKQKNLQDVVKAPPLLVKVKSKFKTKDEDYADLEGKKKIHRASKGYGGIEDDDVGVDVKDVPNAVGSLRRREEMGKKRREIIEGYRKLRGRRLKGKNLSGLPLPSGTIMT